MYPNYFVIYSMRSDSSYNDRRYLFIALNALASFRRFSWRFGSFGRFLLFRLVIFATNENILVAISRILLRVCSFIMTNWAFYSRGEILRTVANELQRIENKNVPQMKDIAARTRPCGVTGYLSPYPTLGIDMISIQRAVG